MFDAICGLITLTLWACSMALALDVLDEEDEQDEQDE